jgi:GMP synthase-like glutamine amidotransferase
MKPILIIQQVWHDTPDYFLDFISARGIAHDWRRMDLGHLIPLRAKGYSGVCVLGGPMSANDGNTLPWLNEQITLIQDAVKERVPVIGHCLGGQLLAKALGGTVQKSPQPEIGWHHINVINTEKAQRFFGMRAMLHLFQWHNESFSIPNGAVQIADSAACPHQAFVYDDIHLGMQFHCEVNAGKLKYWAESEAAEIERCADIDSVHSAQSILTTLDANVAQSHSQADDIYTQWCRALKR